MIINRGFISLKLRFKPSLTILCKCSKNIRLGFSNIKSVAFNASFLYQRTPIVRRTIDLFFQNKENKEGNQSNKKKLYFN